MWWVLFVCARAVSNDTAMPVMYEYHKHDVHVRFEDVHVREDLGLEVAVQSRYYDGDVLGFTTVFVGSCRERWEEVPRHCTSLVPWHPVRNATRPWTERFHGVFSSPGPSRGAAVLVSDAWPRYYPPPQAQDWRMTLVRAPDNMVRYVMNTTLHHMETVCAGVMRETTEDGWRAKFNLSVLVTLPTSLNLAIDDAVVAHCVTRAYAVEVDATMPTDAPTTRSTDAPTASPTVDDVAEVRSNDVVWGVVLVLVCGCGVCVYGAMYPVGCDEPRLWLVLGVRACHGVRTVVCVERACHCEGPGWSSGVGKGFPFEERLYVRSRMGVRVWDKVTWLPQTCDLYVLRLEVCVEKQRRWVEARVRMTAARAAALRRVLPCAPCAGMFKAMPWEWVMVVESEERLRALRWREVRGNELLQF